MALVYDRDNVAIYHGDALAQLAHLPAESIQTCITSPPYWSLRDYGVDGQIGLERTPDEYVDRLVAIMREVRRVLRRDGTLWLNLGDSYASGKRENTNGTAGSTLEYVRESQTPTYKTVGMKLPSREYGTLAHKQLVGVPWRVAFALQADGWWLRSDIIWSKSNPMPESVTDRPTKSHEYVFLLSKSADYYYDAEAIAEPSVYCGPPKPGRQAQTAYTGLPVHQGNLGRGNPNGRNRRTVWTIATQSYEGAHFATFPPDLVRPCVLAGSRPGDVVLDPFAGAGTTLMVAKHLNRCAVGVELNQEYIGLIERRLMQGVLPLVG